MGLDRHCGHPEAHDIVASLRIMPLAVGRAATGSCVGKGAGASLQAASRPPKTRLKIRRKNLVCTGIRFLMGFNCQLSAVNCQLSMENREWVGGVNWQLKGEGLQSRVCV